MFGILGFNAAMGKRQKQVSRPSTSSRQNSKTISPPSKSPIENSQTMPVDLLIEIFSRLALDDVARCRCVSKLWSAILRRPDFTELFLKISTARPKILLTFLHNGRRIFYTVPQDLDPDRDYSAPISPYYQMGFPKGLGGDAGKVCPPILGLIYNNEKKPVICNPSTGEYISFSRGYRMKLMSPFFGYDPVDKLFKVLYVPNKDHVCRVAIVGTGEVTWRKVKCSKPHIPLHTHICIDGIVYYLGIRSELYMVVCFDVRRETFKYLPELDFQIWPFGVQAQLINYKGKLGILWTTSIGINGNTKSFELWTLEDLDEVKWSKTVYILPSCWKNLAMDTELYIVGMTSAGEIVLSTDYPTVSFYLFYFSVMKNIVVRVELEFGSLKPAGYSKVFTFINHVENVALMD